jgi:hypothetical protein
MRTKTASSPRSWPAWLQNLPLYASLVLLVYMPFHVFLAQSLSLFTGGLDYWKIGKDVVLAIITLFAICSVYWQCRQTRLFNGIFLLSLAYGLLHLLLWVFNPDIYQTSALIGLTYNLRLPALLLLGLAAVLLTPNRLDLRQIAKIVLLISGTVAILGVIQYFLP